MKCALFEVGRNILRAKDVRRMRRRKNGSVPEENQEVLWSRHDRARVPPLHPQSWSIRYRRAESLHRQGMTS